jgi:hypothetical protein
MVACFALDGGAKQVSLSKRLSAGDRFMEVRLWGTLKLDRGPVAGLFIGGLSGLAWDEDEALLYAVSDDAKLFHLRPIIVDGMLADVRVVDAYPLRDRHGQPLRRPWSDSEGLALEHGANGKRGDSRLVISFERKPRIQRYRADGRWAGDEPLPVVLRDPGNYADPNKALESVTLHPRHGILTGPEQPMRSGASGRIPVFRMDEASWAYPLHSAPRSSLVAIEALPDGSLLTLERAFVSAINPLVISLRRAEFSPNDGSAPLRVSDLAVFDTSQGWLLDNFEGLARHRERFFFMVSDNNWRTTQTTLLVYFELLGSGTMTDR